MNSKKQLKPIVEDSYNELISLLKWFSHFGPIPTIIGGWAVYFYNSYFGSVDIDIVGPSAQGRFMDIIERYERTHGYEFISKDQLGLEVTSRKPVIQNGKVIGYMEIDACTFEDPEVVTTSVMLVDMDKTTIKDGYFESAFLYWAIWADQETSLVEGGPTVPAAKVFMWNVEVVS